MHRKLLFRSVDMDWREGLPLGNGCFGCVNWFENEELIASFNHYDIYYHPLSQAASPGNPEDYADLLDKARTAKEDQPYQTALYGAFSPAVSPGVNLPSAGEVRFLLESGFQEETRELSLDIEQAALHFSVQKDGAALECTSRILSDVPVSVTEFSRTGVCSLAGLRLCYPDFRPHREALVSFSQPNPHCLIMNVILPDTPQVRGKAFRFSHILYLDGAETVMELQGDSAYLRLTACSPDFRIYSGVFTNLQEEDGPENGLSILEKTAASLPLRLETHRAFWQGCFDRSAISLPDPFLETLWYFDLYLFQCSCGAGGTYAKQASGLHALWDIRKPTQWQSAWYWDVNIQASYWPFFAANHLDLAKVFCEGFFAHTEDIAVYTREFCKGPGLAIDYPHPFYNCIGPWCCQFLWWYYSYTNDLDFLKRAYPVFLAEIQYAESVLEWYEASQSFFIFPDISPEQGPITRNSTITIACLKYLLQFTIEAGKLLGEGKDTADKLQYLLNHLPSYRTADTTEFGTVLCDSDLTPPASDLRHPSLLMPIYPIGEWDTESPEEIQKCIRNTVRYARSKTEYGTFGFGWIACAAARAGDGNLALDTLYTLGLDLHLRANGMPAEETNRWRNFCLVHKPPRYYPAMQEAAGETMAAVNEMLLQSQNGLIRVFPAVPDAWQDCSFERLLAMDGFQVSAARKNGKTVWIQVESLHGKPLRLHLPATLSRTGRAETVCLDLEAGQIHTWGAVPAYQSVSAESLPLCRQSHTGERIFLGKDSRSAFLSETDSFLCDKYLANTRIEQQLASLYLFGGEQASTPAAFSYCQTPFTRLPVPERFSPAVGYGFLSNDGLKPEQTQGHFPFDSCFDAEGETRFCIELPRGRYAVLVCGRFSTQTMEIQVSAIDFRAVVNPSRKGDQAIELLFQAAKDCIAEIRVDIPCRLYGIFLKRI